MTTFHHNEKYLSQIPACEQERRSIRDHTPLSNAQKNALFSGEFAPARDFFDALEKDGKRMITAFVIHNLSCGHEQ